MFKIHYFVDKDIEKVSTNYNLEVVRFEIFEYSRISEVSNICYYSAIVVFLNFFKIRLILGPKNTYSIKILFIYRKLRMYIFLMFLSCDSDSENIEGII